MVEQNLELWGYTTNYYKITEQVAEKGYLINLLEMSDTLRNLENMMKFTLERLREMEKSRV